MAEIFDIFDEQRRPIGTASREEVHRLGFWHQTFHCWVLHRSTEGNSLLLQRRHSTKDTHPNKLDISCAGHLEKGEKLSDGKRELFEELGITVEFDNLQKIGIYKYSAIEGEVIDNEFCHIFIVVNEDGALSNYIPALGEVSGLYLIQVQDLSKLCRQEIETATIRGFDIDDQGTRVEKEINIKLSDMVNHDFAYYEMLFKHIDTM